MCLAQHPDVFIPERKELSFFDVDYGRGWDWYVSYFDNASHRKMKGEWSPGYICREHVFERITEALPDIKVIVLFRNPMDRLFSHYWRYRSAGAVYLPLLEAVRKEEGFVRMSLYANDWERWLNHYGRDRCYAMVFEDLIRNPLAELQKLFCFLDIDGSFEPDLEHAKRRQNAIQLNRHQWLMDGIAWLRPRMRKMGLSSVITLGKHWHLDKVLRRTAHPQKGYGRQSLTLDEKQFLYQEFFVDDIAKLQSILDDRDLSIWIPEVG